MTFAIEPGSKLIGECRVPGDKSISHRAVMLGALAEGITQIDGFLEAEDCLATLHALKQLGVHIEGPVDGRVLIYGRGKGSLTPPTQPLNLGNSGTAMRLLTGLLCAQPFASQLIGDSSLCRRPMQRIIEPLTMMGAKIESTNGCAPLYIEGGSVLNGIHYTAPIASAQVKSCLLLAGLFAEGETRVIEPVITRDHTERLLTSFGYPIKKAEHSVSLFGGGRLTATDMVIPADLSSAAFFMVGACIAPGSDIVLKNVGINPTRVGLIHILREMGAVIRLLNKRLCGDEPVADIAVKYTSLCGIEIPVEYVSLAIDEFPALFVAASVARGQTVLKGARELRYKESDRIAVMVSGLRSLGVQVEEFEDGVIIQGGLIQGGSVEADNDHRIAMAFAIAGLVAQRPITINGCEAVATSFPKFVSVATSLGLKIVES